MNRTENKTSCVCEAKLCTIPKRNHEASLSQISLPLDCFGRLDSQHDTGFGLWACYFFFTFKFFYYFSASYYSFFHLSLSLTTSSYYLISYLFTVREALAQMRVCIYPRA